MSILDIIADLGEQATTAQRMCQTDARAAGWDHLRLECGCCSGWVKRNAADGIIASVQEHMPRYFVARLLIVEGDCMVVRMTPGLTSLAEAMRYVEDAQK